MQRGLDTKELEFAQPQKITAGLSSTQRLKCRMFVQSARPNGDPNRHAQAVWGMRKGKTASPEHEERAFSIVKERE